jgi:hypothetical protein
MDVYVDPSRNQATGLAADFSIAGNYAPQSASHLADRDGLDERASASIRLAGAKEFWSEAGIRREDWERETNDPRAC